MPGQVGYRLLALGFWLLAKNQNLTTHGTPGQAKDTKEIEVTGQRLEAKADLSRLS